MAVDNTNTENSHGKDRHHYECHPRWFADRLNSLPKYVVSSTLEHPQWNNTTVLEGDVAKELTELKQKVDGDILVYASYQLVRTLMEHDLADVRDA